MKKTTEESFISLASLLILDGELCFMAMQKVAGLGENYMQAFNDTETFDSIHDELYRRYRTKIYENMTTLLNI